MLLVNNISCLATMDPEHGTIFGAAILIDDQKILWCGPEKALPAFNIHKIIDAENSLVLPGLIDCHSHLLFAGSRAHEFAKRMDGESYSAIMARGGGIMSTVRSCADASDEQLLRLAHARAHKILSQGVTTLEVKSGYGLSFESELRILRLIKQLKHSQSLELYPTFLGAHVIPPEYKNNPEDYVDLVAGPLLEKIAEEELALDCDVFCETKAFSVEQSYKILKSAHDLGFGLRAHVQQLGASGGVALLERLPIKSISHADFLSDYDISLIARSNCIVEVLPFANLFLRQIHVTPVKKLRSVGINIAIATDFNPGSAMCDDLILAARLALTLGDFDIHAALEAITSVAARSLGREDIGVIKAGNKADFLISQHASIEEFFYDWSKNPVRAVIKNGCII